MINLFRHSGPRGGYVVLIMYCAIHVLIFYQYQYV